MKKFFSRKETEARKYVIADPSSFDEYSDSVSVTEGIHSSSSLRSDAKLSRFLVCDFSYLSNARFLVIFAKKSFSTDGFAGGILFHARSHVSFTHSLLSSSRSRMLFATAKQYFPYFHPKPKRLLRFFQNTERLFFHRSNRTASFCCSVRTLHNIRR